MDNHASPGFCGVDCGACKNYGKNMNCAGCRGERKMLSDCPARARENIIRLREINK